MLSRRNIRVKAMQALYAHHQDAEKTADRLEKSMLENINGASRCFLYHLYVICKTAEFVNTDIQIQSSKLLRQEQSDSLSVSIFFNPVVQHLVVTEDLYREIQREKLDLKTDRNYFRQLFQKLKKTEEYTAYAMIENPLLPDDKLMISFLYRSVLSTDELFQQLMDDLFPTWADDREVIFHAVNHYIETAAPNQPPSVVRQCRDMREVKQFASELLRKTITHEQETLELIIPFLEHWEKERVALLDMVLMKLAVTEWLYFPEIPVKVTINEYIDLSKLYSTPKSGEFINGILDAILKKLKQEERIHKVGRGAIES